MSDTQTVEARAEIPAAAPEPIEDAGSLSDHEASFSSGRKAPKEPAPKPEPVAAAGDEGAAPVETRDDKGRFRKPASKDVAGPADVPRIRELTKKLHDLERERDEWKSKVSAPAAAVVQPAAPVTPAVPAIAATFTEREPFINDFVDDKDPQWYEKYLRALGRYDRKKEQFDADQVAAKTRAEQHEKDSLAQAEATFAKVQSDYQARLEPFKAAHKDFDGLLKASADAPLPPLLQATVLLHDKGPEFVYHLLRHPDQLAEMTLLTDGKAVTDQNVAIATRWLTSRATAASTGSTVPIAQKPFAVPRPPNPVLTGPMSAGDELPDEQSSLAEHEGAFYHGKRKTARRR